MTMRHALWAVIGVSTLLRFALAASMGGLLDEAYYVLYGQNLDWAYFDHPPMLGLVAAVGAKLAGWVSPLMGLRVGFIALFAGSSWLLARITERFFSPRAGVLAALILNSTLFYGMIVGTTAGPDGPLLFFWLLTLDRLTVALGPDGRTSAWVGVGFAWGAAMLSKYHAVMLPVGVVLYLVVRPAAARCLKTVGPYLATVIGLTVFSPVVYWNASHGWASFRFHSQRSGGFQGFRFVYVLEAVVGQVGYLLPWVWFGLLAVFVSRVRRGPRRWGDGEAFLIAQFVPVVALFMGVSTFSRIMTHWPLIGFVALMPILGQALSDRLDARSVLLRCWLGAAVAAPIVVAVLYVAHLNYGVFQDARGRLAGLIPAQVDPTVDTIRWDQIARELKRRGLCDDPNTFLFTDNWRFSAQLALATRYEVPVACYHRDSRSYTFWSRPDDWLGRDGIFVRVFDGLAYPEYFAPWFTRVEPIGEFPVTRSGWPMQTVLLFRCVRQTAGFPFGYTGPGPVPIPKPAGDQAGQDKAMIGLAHPKGSAGRKTR